jgi:hypothetical protein
MIAILLANSKVCSTFSYITFFINFSYFSYSIHPCSLQFKYVLNAINFIQIISAIRIFLLRVFLFPLWPFLLFDQLNLPHYLSFIVLFYFLLLY